MKTVKVSRYKVWSVSAGDYVEARRYATLSAISSYDGVVIAGTELEIDAADINSEGTTELDYKAS
jgi:hypothetical protein